MMMQPQDYVTKVAEEGKQAKIDRIVKAFELETASAKKTLK